MSNLKKFREDLKVREEVEQRIERGLILWLRERHGITAIAAYSGESEVERGWSSGCESCGYGADADTVYFEISYKASGDEYWNSLRVEGTNLNFLPELLPFIDRAN